MYSSFVGIIFAIQYLMSSSGNEKYETDNKYVNIVNYAKNLPEINISGCNYTAPYTYRAEHELKGRR